MEEELMSLVSDVYTWSISVAEWSVSLVGEFTTWDRWNDDVMLVSLMASRESNVIAKRVLLLSG